MKRNTRTFLGTLTVCLCLAGLLGGMLVAESHTQRMMTGDSGALTKQGASLASGLLDGADAAGDMGQAAWAPALPASWRAVGALPAWGIRAAERLFGWLDGVLSPQEAPSRKVESEIDV